MKTLRFFLIALAVPFMLASCSKSSDEVNPDLGVRVSGSYAFSRVIIDGKESPIEQSNITGGAIIDRLTETTVKVNFDFKVATSRTQGFVDNVILTDAGNGEVELNKDGFNLGRYGKNVVSLKVNLTNSAGAQQAIVLIGAK